jgi:hypothetical protein
MTEYVRRPARVQALQFTTGGGNAEAIAQALIPLGVTTTWIPEHNQFGLNEVNEIEATIIAEILRLTDTVHNMEWNVPPGHWVAVNELNELTIYTSAEFASMFQAV